MTDNVIILCAGKATRYAEEMKRFTAPKCLLSLGDETILDRQVRLLRERDLLDIIIVIRNDTATEFTMHTFKHQFLTQAHFIPDTPVNYEVSHTVYNCLDLMSDTLVLLGDVVFHSETLDEILDRDFSDMLFIEKTLWPKKNFPRNERTCAQLCGMAREIYLEDEEFMAFELV